MNYLERLVRRALLETQQSATSNLDDPFEKTADWPLEWPQPAQKKLAESSLHQQEQQHVPAEQVSIQKSLSPREPDKTSSVSAPLTDLVERNEVNNFTQERNIKLAAEAISRNSINEIDASTLDAALSQVDAFMRSFQSPLIQKILHETQPVEEIATRIKKTAQAMEEEIIQPLNQSKPNSIQPRITTTALDLPVGDRKTKQADSAFVAAEKKSASSAPTRNAQPPNHSPQLVVINKTEGVGINSTLGVGASFIGLGQL